MRGSRAEGAEAEGIERDIQRNEPVFRHAQGEGAGKSRSGKNAGGEKEEGSPSGCFLGADIAHESVRESHPDPQTVEILARIISLQTPEKFFLGSARRPFGGVADEQGHESGFKRIDRADQAVEAAREQRERVEGRRGQSWRPGWHYRLEACGTRPETYPPSVTRQEIEHALKQHCCG